MGNLSIEPFIFLGSIVCFFLPILMKKYIEYVQFFAGFILVLSVMVFHEELQIRILFLIAFIWVMGSISAVGMNQKRIDKSKDV